MFFVADKNYLTIAKEAMDEFVEKKSRFMGFIKPVTTEEEAQAFIREKQKGCWDATDNVYAYVLEGGKPGRFSDDGDPFWTSCVKRDSPTVWWWSPVTLAVSC